MKLSVGDRLIILSILPLEEDFKTLKIVRKLKEDLSFSEEEHKEYQFVQEEDMVRWDDKAEQFKDIPIGEKATDIIEEAFKRLNNQKRLREEHLPLYEKFVEKAKGEG